VKSNSKQRARFSGLRLFLSLVDYDGKDEQVVLQPDAKLVQRGREAVGDCARQSGRKDALAHADERIGVRFGSPGLASRVGCALTMPGALAEIGAVPSIGTVGDSFDNALAETVNGYYKAELIRGPARSGPWRTVEDVELATLGWSHWHNTARLHGYLNDVPPAEFEDTFYATNRTNQPLVEIQ
jgi:putative transposase